MGRVQNSWGWVLIIGVSVLVGVVVWFSLGHDSDEPERTGESPEKPAPVSSVGFTEVAREPSGNSPEAIQERMDAEHAEQEEARRKAIENDPKLSDSEKKLRLEIDYGTTPPVSSDFNPQTRSVVEAVKTGDHPERLSPLIAPKAFDSEAYKENPKAYLDVVEPGRCFQSKQPGEGVPRIRIASPQLQNVAQGESVKLRVKAPAGYPVTFTSFDLGRFGGSMMTSESVEADESGMAEVDFFGMPGTINEVTIQAASPMASGHVKFLVNVTKP